VNDYQWGDFEGDPSRLVERYYHQTALNTRPQFTTYTDTECCAPTSSKD
jgi:hypothetical protein